MSDATSRDQTALADPKAVPVDPPRSERLSTVEPPSEPLDAAPPALESLPAELSAEQRRELYRLLVTVRHLDLSAIAWQRQGLIPGYAPCRGQEAAQIGSAFAMQPQRDFAFPTYRELGVARAWGVDMVDYMATHKATGHGGLYNPARSRFAPIQAVVAGSALHAVGWAHGQRLDQPEPGPEGYGVAISYFGDGASSQGDVHEAMNFAGVFGSPVIFFVQNNGWAISVPTEQQVAGGSVAARGAGYGFPSLLIDGDDVEAVVAATRTARAHAASGAGPVLIEAMTYRRGPHSTSDDPGRYRSLDEERREGGVDPVDRYAQKLLSEGLVDQEFLEQAQRDAEAEENRVRTGVAALGPRPGAEMFDFVFADPPSSLTEQAASWRTEHDDYA
ncbi:thiamine pyrophosphate-dependent enzyme [Acaricomes phytoseiuli]|uniref:thiamine pyrophosphate-dependent enzyme n=1 Tax=Acaricomes phytoseiuli TaxID=291968 RepID=UPI000371F2FB